MKNNISIIVLAAGKGTRMKSDLPKVLHKIKNKSILEMAMENFKKYGFKIFNISTYYKSCSVKKYFKRIYFYIS